VTVAEPPEFMITPESMITLEFVITG